MAGGEEVKVLGAWSSPYASRVELTLNLKGIPYELVQQDVINKSPELLKYNPVYKKIPVLVHNGNPICESQIILEYIDETWKQNPILPQHPYDKAMARFWANVFDTKFMSAVQEMILSSEEETKVEGAKKAEEVLRLLEEELKVKGKKFFGGEFFGFLDIVTSWLSVWVSVVEELAGVKFFDPQNFPLLATWIDDCLQLPVVKENLPPHHKLVEYFRSLLSMFA